MTSAANKKFALSKYLIYSNFETKMPTHLSACSIRGSLLLDSAMTKEEAEAKLEMYKQRSDNFSLKFPLSKSDNTTHIYIENRSEWWPRTD